MKFPNFTSTLLILVYTRLGIARDSFPEPHDVIRNNATVFQYTVYHRYGVVTFLRLRHHC